MHFHSINSSKMFSKSSSSLTTQPDEETMQCTMVVDFTVGDDGKRVNVFCKNRFPMNDEGPHNFYTETCGPCYMAQKEEEKSQQATVASVVKEIRVFWSGRSGSCIQYSDQTSRVMLDDGSLDVTVSQDVYVEKWAKQLRFQMCHDKGCVEVATRVRRNNDCNLSYCASHYPRGFGSAYSVCVPAGSSNKRSASAVAAPAPTQVLNLLS